MPLGWALMRAPLPGIFLAVKFSSSDFACIFLLAYFSLQSLDSFVVMFENGVSYRQDMVKSGGLQTAPLYILRSVVIECIERLNTHFRVGFRYVIKIYTVSACERRGTKLVEH